MRRPGGDRPLGLHAEGARAGGGGSQEMLRMVTYNIKGFGSGFFPGKKDPAEVARAYSKVLADLQRLRPQVICLNEVVRFTLTDGQGKERGDSLDMLAEDLGDMQAHFQHATPGFEKFGNAVLVSPELAFVGRASVHLDGGSVVSAGEGRTKKIVRCALAVRLRDSAGAELAVLSTHLDHISEAERMSQAAHICREGDELCGGLPHVLMGDLNAMNRDDYAPDEWRAIAARHEAKGWPPPEACSSLGLLQDAGYSDLLKATLLEGGGDSLAVVDAANKMTAPAAAPEVRIDYAFCSPKLVDFLASRGSSTPCARAWVDNAASGSDHLPLVVELPWP